MGKRKLSAEEVAALGLDDSPPAPVRRKLAPEEVAALGLEDGPAPAPPGPTDLGAGTTFGMHAARHLSFGMGDKVIAGLQALSDKLHDRTGKVTLSDAYRRDLAFNDKALEDSDTLHPAARWAGNGVGVVGSMLVPVGVGRLGAMGALGADAAEQAAARAMVPRLPLGALARAGGKTGLALGALGGFGGSRADTLGGTALDTGLGAATGLGMGLASPYAGALLSRGASALGEGAQNLAGRLKIHSLHPTPTLGEKLADLPGGEAAAGRMLLEDGLGGLTRRGTAEQIDAAGKEAAQVAGRLARNYDSAGGAPVDIAPAVFRAAARAQELQAEPTTKAAGQKLEQLLMDYAEKYRSGTTTAEDALRLKRALGDEVYGAKVALGNGDTLGGRYGEGLAQMQRGVDDALDNALGPKFADANLRVRQLMGAGQAADRSAGKTLHPLGLIPTMVGLGVGGAHGAEGGAAATLAAMLLHKYGYQAGARGLYTLGQLASGVGRALPRAATYAATASQQVNPYVEALLAGLRRQSQAQPTALAMENP